MPSSLLTTQRAMLALIQSGLAYTTDPFDKDRYQKLQTLLIQQWPPLPTSPLLT